MAIENHLIEYPTIKGIKTLVNILIARQHLYQKLEPSVNNCEEKIDLLINHFVLH